MTEYLQVETVIALHTEAVRRYGGSPGLADRGRLESALAQPRAVFDGEELHRTVADKAAGYLFFLSQAHAFVDGNKRVAAAAAIYFLLLNGQLLVASQREVEEVALRVACGGMGREEVATWIETRILQERTR